MIKLASHCPLRRRRGRKSALPEISKIVGARKGLLHSFLEPSLAAMCDTPPSGAKWVHEIKYDGYRMQARIDGQDVRLLTRKNLDWTRHFRSIAVALKELRVGSAQLDGEIVVEDANGISSFNELQSDLKAGRQDRFAYHVFDIHHCDGFDLTQVTLVNRKAVDDYQMSETVPCVSVGFLIADTKSAIAIAPNLGDVGRDRTQASGIIRIPRSAVRSIRRL